MPNRDKQPAWLNDPACRREFEELRERFELEDVVELAEQLVRRQRQHGLQPRRLRRTTH